MKLEIGYHHDFEVRKETYFSSCKDNFSVLYLSDLHLNQFSKNSIQQIEKTITELNPTIVLLGGDYMDSKKGLVYLNVLLASLSHRQHVFAIAGNHDYFFGIKEIKSSMEANNIVWIEQDSVCFKYKNTTIRINGNKVYDERRTIDFSILVLHKPLNPVLFQDNYDLAFAGHLHGCQVILWQKDNKLYPGKFVYKWNILKMKLKTCQYFISKGLGDTLPIRYNCKKDLLFIEVISTT